MNFDSTPNWCLSGGAQGADLAWGESAAQRGHGVIHFSFSKHRTDAPPDAVVILSRDQLVTADAHCAAARRALRRHFPIRSAYATDLIRRNWFQVAEAQACYAISCFTNLTIKTTLPLGTVLDHMDIRGGTAWAVEMFIERHMGRACACYLFDQEVCHWFRWNGDGWECIYHPPQPSGIWAGIGTRNLKPIGRLAIRVVLQSPES